VAKRVDGNALLGNLLVTVGDLHVPTADFVVKFSWMKKNRKDLTHTLKGWKQQIGQNDCMEKRKANHSERTMKTTWPWGAAGATVSWRLRIQTCHRGCEYNRVMAY